MSTSGVSAFELNSTQFIEAALRKLGVLSEGSTANAEQLSTGVQALNSLLKLFITKGMPLWAIKEYTFNTVVGINTYTIGNGQTLATPVPLKVIQATRLETSNSVNIPMNIVTHYDFNNLPVNSNTGTPINLFYQPFSNYGVIKLWPSPITSTTTITITYQRPFDDMISASNNVDFPSYWTDAIIYTLAWRLAPEYGTSTQERASVATEAKMFTEEALSFGLEEGSLYLSPYHMR